MIKFDFKRWFEDIFSLKSCSSLQLPDEWMQRDDRFECALFGTIIWALVAIFHRIAGSDVHQRSLSSCHDVSLNHSCFTASRPLDGSITFGLLMPAGQLSSNTNIQHLFLFLEDLTKKKNSKQDAALNNLEKGRHFSCHKSKVPLSTLCDP